MDAYGSTSAGPRSKFRGLGPPAHGSSYGERREKAAERRPSPSDPGAAPNPPNPWPWEPRFADGPRSPRPARPLPTLPRLRALGRGNRLGARGGRVERFRPPG